MKVILTQLAVAYEVDNKTCSDSAVGFEYGLLPDDNITATSSLHDKVSWNKARLGGEEAWCPQSNSSVEYLEVALDSLHRICALATQGFHAIGAYTMTYRLQLSIDGSKWEWYNDGSSEVSFLYVDKIIGFGSSSCKVGHEWLDSLRESNRVHNRKNAL